ncbi:hypothetical protein OD917_13355 [Flavobacterium sp. SH_e]|uniref:hypothetical protein n=1 Tax=Flavobacterium sp. SH_e TaxID=2983767 RepID=UPI0021E3A83A|nr:hypothetical protein [Flavobacterium sp. SH_e]MCV2485918.1 hypothetical protein [Flavobacterium sp. SH_e]
MKFYISIFVMFFNLTNSQNLSGVWKGELSDSRGNVWIDDFEMQILQTKSSLNALVVYKYKSDGVIKTAKRIAVQSDNFAHNSDCGCVIMPGTIFENIKYSSKDIRFTENKHIWCNMSENHKYCNYINYNLKWSKKGNDEFLTGKFFPITNYQRIEGIVKLKKIGAINSSQSFFIKRNTLQKIPSIVAKPQIVKYERSDLALRNVYLQDKKEIPVVIKTRKNEKLKTIKVNSKQVEISIYDYGQIDHDIISVYVDKEPVLVKEELTKKPLLINLEMDDYNNFHEVILVAENLGDIPPNTALMKIKAGEKYEIKITSDEQKNAVINFKYKE